MRIAAISDLHYPRHVNAAQLRRLVLETSNLDPDVLVLAGDLGDEGLERDVLEAFAETDVPYRLFVPGNHELFCTPPQGFMEGLRAMLKGEENSMDRYQRLIDDVANFGYHMLDGAPLDIQGIGFIGNIGWYDYSFKPEGDAIVRVDYQRKPLSALSDADFREKHVGYTLDGKERSLMWADRNKIHMPFDDKEFSRQCLSQLQRDITHLRSDTVVCVLHHVPFKENLKQSSNPGFMYTQAYMGSSKLGEWIADTERIKHVIHGHAHSGAGTYRASDIVCYNVAANGKRRMTVLEIE